MRFAQANKAVRGYRLARTGGAEPRRRGGPAARFDPDATVETVARDIFRDCLGQVAANMALVAESTAIEGPHQLRVGLRRLRTAFAVFGPSLGEGAMAPLSEAARELGGWSGRLRDVDVLVEEVVGGRRELGLDAPARGGPRRRARGPAASRCAPRCARRWRRPRRSGSCSTSARSSRGAAGSAPSDYSQTDRLAAPVGDVAPAILDRRRRKARKRGEDPPARRRALHELRKELKKLRYAVDMLGPIYKETGSAATSRR